MQQHTRAPVTAKKLPAQAVKTATPAMSKAATKPALATASSAGKSKVQVVSKRSGPPSGGLPVTNPSKPLRFKQPQLKGKNQEELITNRLKKKSPWYQSLVDPLRGADVKIPDSVGVETGTLQLVQKGTIRTASPGTIAGIRTVCLHPNLSGSGPDPENYQELLTTSTVTDLDWNPSLLEFDTSRVLQQYAQGVRVVSASLSVQSEASLNSNQGAFTAYCLPYGHSLTPNSQPLSVYQNYYKSAVIPINNNQPAEVLFFPVKENGGMYDMFYRPEQPTGAGYDDSGPDNPIWEMGIIINTTATVDYLWTICVNYEFIPLENSINILDAKPSPTDAQEVDLVENWVQDMPITGMVSTKKVSTPPMTSPVPEPGAPTGFGMFFEVLKELAPLALALI